MGKCGVQYMPMGGSGGGIQWTKLRDITESGSGVSESRNGLYLVDTLAVEGAEEFDFLAARFRVEINVTEYTEFHDNSSQSIYITDGCARSLSMRPQAIGVHGLSALTILKANSVSWTPISAPGIVSSFDSVPYANYTVSASNIGRVMVQITLCSAEATIHHELYGGKFQ